MLKINGLLKTGCMRLYRDFLSILTIISPELNTKFLYIMNFKKKLDLDNPITLEEKLLWLKLKNYNYSELVGKCSDKVQVREYIKQKGLSHILNDVIGIYNDASEIIWDQLPNRFVIKWNFGATMNLICNDKDKLDIEATCKQLNKWKKNKYWLPYSEMQYKRIPKKIIIEKFLMEEENKSLTDYKVYCFNGEPLAILVMHDRGGVMKTEFFDTSWNKLENTLKYVEPKEPTKKPSCLEKLLEVSRSLSAPFPFVRCDYYIVKGRVIFGEMTFTPAGGLFLSQTKVNGKDMSEYLVL